MHAFAAWSGFLGAWLLVAGPIYQAAIELAAEHFERDGVAAISATVPLPPKVSPWWWLLPPAGYLLNRRRSRAYRGAVMQMFTDQQLEAFVRFSNKATGWVFVAGGAFFIAVKETWELSELHAWPTAVFWVVVVAMVALCAVNTAFRMRRSSSVLASRPPAPDAAHR